MLVYQRVTHPPNWLWFGHTCRYIFSAGKIEPCSAAKFPYWWVTQYLWHSLITVHRLIQSQMIPNVPNVPNVNALHTHMQPMVLVYLPLFTMGDCWVMSFTYLPLFNPYLPLFNPYLPLFTIFTIFNITGWWIGQGQILGFIFRPGIAMGYLSPSESHRLRCRGASGPMGQAANRISQLDESVPNKSIRIYKGYIYSRVVKKNKIHHNINQEVFFGATAHVLSPRGRIVCSSLCASLFISWASGNCGGELGGHTQLWDDHILGHATSSWNAMILPVPWII